MYNILICDDEKDIVSALKIYLKTSGYNIYEAYNGKEALEQIKEHDIHLVLMDIMMPVMDGYQTTRAIRSLDRPDAKTIPILAMTANAFAEDRQKTYAAGMDEHLTKPLDTELLLKTIAKYTPEKKAPMTP